ncbi:MAG: sulfotransferase, partial [Gemmatimonadaceae bacterium]|nr:sulfotransferase [Gloeobacterales cyanobacterium ES-bin-141]
MNTLRNKALIELERAYLNFELPPVLGAPMVWFEQAFFDQGLDQIKIDRPIFVVGCHRSGTTVLYETLAKHPDLVYFTNGSSLSPHTPILINRLMDLMGKRAPQVERFVKDGLTVSYATPSEGIRIWELYAPEGGDYCLDETYSNPKMEQYLRLAIKKHLKHFNG